MLSEDKTILIEKFLNGEASDTERSAFEKLLTEDAEFREEVKLQRSIVKGINMHGKELLKKELAGIFMEVQPDLNGQKYKPKSGNAVTKFLKWIVPAGIIGAGAFYLIHQNTLQPPAPVQPTETVQPQPAKKIRKPHMVPTSTTDTVWNIHLHIKGQKKVQTFRVHSQQEADSIERVIRDMQ
ncbi:MAG: hypothetical protein JWO06_608 [Bacteroidota bacterium]|nr:hypothetical protein [Bacteroidota bacterium]